MGRFAREPVAFFSELSTRVARTGARVHLSRPTDDSVPPTGRDHCRRLHCLAGWLYPLESNRSGQGKKSSIATITPG